MLEETFPNRTVSAVRVKIRTLWARGLAVKISTVVPWTEEELQTFMNHPSGFHDASDEELLCAFPGRTMPAISRKLGTWRRSLKATPSDLEHWTEQDYETFLEHPRFFSSNYYTSCPPFNPPELFVDLCVPFFFFKRRPWRRQRRRFQIIQKLH